MRANIQSSALEGSLVSRHASAGSGREAMGGTDCFLSTVCVGSQEAPRYAHQPVPRITASQRAVV